MKPAILDCTLRDGGLVNDFYFSDKFVKALYQANLEAGVDYMEFGYKASEQQFDPDKFGKWKFCREEHLREIVGDNQTPMKISVMADLGRTQWEELPDKKDSVVDMIRIAAYSSQISQALDRVHYCHSKGYETTINIMAISNDTTETIQAFLEQICQSEADVIYLVDSFGSFYPQELRRLARLYESYGSKSGKIIGIHAHNNQQLAFANTIEALSCGIGLADATYDGLGRGAGNCAMEMLLGYFETGRERELPVLKFIETYILPMKAAGCRWGYEIPYLITGQGKVHPSKAINFIRQGRTEFSAMYSQTLLSTP